MRTMTDRRRPAIALVATAMLLAACSGEKRSDKVATAPAAPPPVATPATPLAPAAPLPPPVPPETLAAVDAALAGVKAFNAKALTDLAAIEKAERRIRDQAARALEAARRGDGARVAAARADAEAAHKGLVDGLAAFRTAASGQQAAMEAAVALCGPPAADPLAPTATLPPKPVVTTPAPATPGSAPVAPDATGLAAYAGCLALPAEQALLAQNIEAVAARHQAAETAYRQDRAKLEEAAATMALGR